MTKKAKKAPSVMFTPKNTQNLRPAAIAHLDELLDEALKETFPASDPIAINIELESAEQGNSHDAPLPLPSTRKALWRR
jgi:hypothetical protein